MLQLSATDRGGRGTADHVQGRRPANVANAIAFHGRVRRPLPGRDANGECAITTAERVTCPRCGRTSYNRTDVREGYCAACHDWTGPRFGVVASFDVHGGHGWTVFDRFVKRETGGWFVDRIAAERTAAVLNAPGESPTADRP